MVSDMLTHDWHMARVEKVAPLLSCGKVQFPVLRLAVTAAELFGGGDGRPM